MSVYRGHSKPFHEHEIGSSPISFNDVARCEICGQWFVADWWQIPGEYARSRDFNGHIVITPLLKWVKAPTWKVLIWHFSAYISLLLGGR
jgi:hypothetical protein